MRKTPFQRHREEEEKRKKREEEEAAKVYEDFVESFGEKPEEKTGSKSFVRGGTIQPGSVAPAPEPSRRSSKYVPSFIPPAMAASVSRSEEKLTAPQTEESVFPLPSSARADRGKKRNIDKMLETMKREQEMRSERQRQRQERGSSFGPSGPIDDGLGSFDDGDPFTTNLYVGNLAPDVDEEVLKREFLRYGDIASIKVMWPRDDDQRRRGRNCGFVAYMTRHGAESAKDDLNGALLHDLDLKIGWGKAIVLPPIPMYTSSGVGGLAPMLQAARAAAQAPPPGQPGQHLTAPWGQGEKEEDPHSGTGPDIVVKAPEDARIRFIIDSVACYVMVDGCNFEQALMSRESQNPEFLFLFDLKCPEHAYYRWRLYSLAQGDSLRNWRNEPFVMVEGGPRWIPPSMTASSGRQQTAAQRGGEAKEKDKPLSDLQRDRFEDILRALTLERTSICDAMVFALDNADSAFEVVETLSDSLTLPETPLTTKVARLMLASDVLHNSTAHVHNASRYRSLLEASLPDIFESLKETYQALESRMEQETLRRKVLRLLRVWRSWFIFSDDYLNGLQATFLKSKTGDSDSPALRAELEALDPDSLAIRCRRNGLSRAGDRNAQIQRLLNLQAYLSGDVKAEPPSTAATAAADDAIQAKLAERPQGVFSINAHPEARPAAEPVKEEPVDVKPETKQEPKVVDGPVSKWTMVDYDDESAAFPDPMDATDDIFPDLEKTPVVASGVPVDPLLPPAASSPAANPQEPSGPPEAAEKPADGRAGGERMDAAEEGRRARLRQVEVDLLLFREGLEDQGLSKDEVERKVEEQRNKLVLTAERKSVKEPISTPVRDAGEKSKHSKEARRDKAKESTHSASPEGDRRTLKKEKKDKTKDKPKEREREKEKEKEKEQEKEREKRKAREAASRKRSRSRSKSRERRRSKSRSRSRGRRRSRSRSRGRDRSAHRSKSRDRHHDESQTSRDRHRDDSREGRRSRSRERWRESSRDREAKHRRRSVSRGRDASESRRDAFKKSSRKETRERTRSRSPRKAKHSKRN